MEWDYARHRWHCNGCGANDYGRGPEEDESDDSHVPPVVIVMHPPKVYSGMLKGYKSEEVNVDNPGARDGSTVVDSHQ